MTVLTSAFFAYVVLCLTVQGSRHIHQANEHRERREDE